MKKETLRHKLFGHIWEPSYIGNGRKWKFIGVHCKECDYGREELLHFIMTHKHTFATYAEEYFK